MSSPSTIIAVDGTDWRDFKFTFKAEGIAAKNNRLGLLSGPEKVPVWLKDVTLVEKPSPSTDRGRSAIANHAALPRLSSSSRWSRCPG